MRHRIYYHITWTTRDRFPLIDHEVSGFLRQFLSKVAREERATIVELGIVDNHVHVLVRAHPNTDVPRLVQRFKGASARLANKHGIARRGLGLRWAKGYSIESVGPRALEAARSYVRSQTTRHPEHRVRGIREGEGVNPTLGCRP